MKKLCIGLFILALSTPAAAQEAAPRNPVGQSARSEAAANKTAGWLVVVGSIAAGAALTTYGLTIDCAETDTDCHRRAALPIWGGVGVASAGSLIGLCIVESPSGPSGSAVSLNLKFD